MKYGAVSVTSDIVISTGGLPLPLTSWRRDHLNPIAPEMFAPATGAEALPPVVASASLAGGGERRPPWGGTCHRAGEVGVPSDPSLSEKPGATCSTASFSFFFFFLAIDPGFAAELEIAKRVFAPTTSCGRTGETYEPAPNFGCTWLECNHATRHPLQTLPPYCRPPPNRHRLQPRPWQHGEFAPSRPSQWHVCVSSTSQRRHRCP
jgi:hypothetical protein